MECGNYFCIYWSDRHCVLTEISLDIQGQCEDCIYVEIEEEILERHRQKILDCYESGYTKREEQ